MNDVDELLRAELDRAFPRPPRRPDWDAVLRRVRRPRRRRRHDRRGRARARASLRPRSPRSAVARRAELHRPRARRDRRRRATSSRWSSPRASTASVVDLATGADAPAKIRTVYVLDSGSSERIPTLSSWRDARRRQPSRSTTQGNPADEPGLATFVGGYRKALADGTAKVVGETTYRGRRAKVVRFSFDYATALDGKGLATPVHDPGGATEDVAGGRVDVPPALGRPHRDGRQRRAAPSGTGSDAT